MAFDMISNENPYSANKMQFLGGIAIDASASCTGLKKSQIFLNQTNGTIANISSVDTVVHQ